MAITTDHAGTKTDSTGDVSDPAIPATPANEDVTDGPVGGCVREGDQPTVRRPRVTDATPVFELATQCGLDQNSRYAYALWCLEFAETTAVAEYDGKTIGFAMCFARPSDPERLFVWQIGVDAEFRGHGTAQRLLDVVQAGRYRYVECTVTPDNHASRRNMAKFAQARGAALTARPYLGTADLGGDHEPEELLTVGPIDLENR